MRPSDASRREGLSALRSTAKIEQSLGGIIFWTRKVLSDYRPSGNNIVEQYLAYIWMLQDFLVVLISPNLGDSQN
jgi:hypothetical protein